LAVLVDAVTDTAEKPNGHIGFGFDTQNKRYDVKDPTKHGTPGYYSTYVGFTPPGGSLRDRWLTDPSSPGIDFPPGKIHFTWSHGPSPIPNDDETRLKPHVLYYFMFSKQLLTNKYDEIGFRTDLYQTGEIFTPMVIPNMTGHAKMSFSPIPIPELPWPAIALGCTVGAAALATRKMSRRQLLLIPFSSSGRNKHRGG
jgi:hypothetical protein